jgi:hypothetical protein
MMRPFALGIGVGAALVSMVFFLTGDTILGSVWQGVFLICVAVLLLTHPR